MLLGDTGAGALAFSKYPIAEQPPAPNHGGRAKRPLRDELMLGEQVGTQTGPLAPQLMVDLRWSGHDML